MPIFNITNVAGSSPNWILTVDTSAGVFEDNSLLAKLDGYASKGGIYRVTSIPDANTINVIDDLDEVLVGKPGICAASCWAPTEKLGLTQIPDGGMFWGVGTREDLKKIDKFLGNVVYPMNFSLEDPIDEISQDNLEEYSNFFINVTFSTTPGQAAKSAAVSAVTFDLSAASEWYLKVISDVDGASDIVLPTAIIPGDLHAVSVEALVTALNTVISGRNDIHFVINETGEIEIVRYFDSKPLIGSAFWVQVQVPVSLPDLNSIMGFDLVQHDGVDSTEPEIVVPAPSDPVLSAGRMVKLVKINSSVGNFKVLPVGANPDVVTMIDNGVFLQLLWDGSCWNYSK